MITRNVSTRLGISFLKHPKDDSHNPVARRRGITLEIERLHIKREWISKLLKPQTLGMAPPSD